MRASRWLSTVNSLARLELEHASFGLDQNIVEVAIVATCGSPDAVERLKSALIEKHARNDVEPLIAGRPRNAGKTRQALAFGKYFFNHKVKPAAAGRLSSLDQAREPPEILMRIAQPVDVVEAQPLQSAVRDQPRDQTMNGLERTGVLDAQAGERIDVEKSPIVDIAAGKPPMGKPVVLAFQQMMQGEQRRPARRTSADRL